MASNRRKRMANRSQQPVQVNGLYVHASPPRVVQMNPSVMRQWLRGGDLDKLEQVVLEGQGSRLVGEYSADPKTRSFIRSVPSFLSKIDAAHAAASRGRLKELQDLIGSEKRIQLVLAKDRSGVGLLHKAVFHDHGSIVEWLIQSYPATVNSKDREGRSSLHYCGAGSDAQYTWRKLIEAGADPQQADVRGRVPAYYMDNPDDLRLPASPADSEEIRRITAARDGFIVKPSNIRIWIHDQDLGRLKKVLWEGHGNRLRTETSKYPAVKKFLEFVPYAMNAIRDTHAAAISGDLEAFQNRSAEPAPVDLIMSKDSNGLTPLHKSAGLGNVGVTEEILQRASRATVLTDNLGRTPLHYSVLLKDQSEMYNTLIREGADELAVDNLGRTAEYYRGRAGDLDASLLRIVPDAPRTSSIYPPSWDWNVLATDGYISNQTSGASRRPGKTSRTSGAERSEDGGSPLDEPPTSNGPVNGEAGADEDRERPKTSDNDVITTTDSRPSENTQDYPDPANNGRLDSQNSSAADGVIDEQQVRIIKELFPEFQTFLRRLSDLGEIYERAGLDGAPSPDAKIIRPNSQTDTMWRRSPTVVDENRLTVPEIRVNSPESWKMGSVNGEFIGDRVELEDKFPENSGKTDFSLPLNESMLTENTGRRNQNTASDQDDDLERSNMVANVGTSNNSGAGMEQGVSKAREDLETLDDSNSIEDMTSDDSGGKSLETENSASGPQSSGQNVESNGYSGDMISEDRELDLPEAISTVKEFDMFSRGITPKLGQVGNEERTTKAVIQLSDHVNSRGNNEQSSNEGYVRNTDVVSGLPDDKVPILQGEVAVIHAREMEPNSAKDVFSFDRVSEVNQFEEDIQGGSTSDTERHGVNGSSSLDSIEMTLLGIGNAEEFGNEVLQSNEASGDELATPHQTMDDINGLENTEKGQELPDLVEEAVRSSSTLILEPENTECSTGSIGNERAGNRQDEETWLGGTEIDTADGGTIISAIESITEEREITNRDFQADPNQSEFNQQFVPSTLNVTKSNLGLEVIRTALVEDLNVQKAQEIENVEIREQGDFNRTISQPPEERRGVFGITNDLSIESNFMNKDGEFREQVEMSLDRNTFGTDIVSESSLQLGSDLRNLFQCNHLTMSESRTDADLAADITELRPDISTVLENSTDEQIPQVNQSFVSISFEERAKNSSLKSLPEPTELSTNLSILSTISTNKLQTERKSTDDVQVDHLTAIKDHEMIEPVILRTTQSESFGLIEESIRGHQRNGESFLADSLASEVVESTRNEGLTRTLRQSAVEARSDMNKRENDGVSQRLDTEGDNTGQDDQIVGQEVENSLEYNPSTDDAQAEQDGSTGGDSLPENMAFLNVQDQESLANLQMIEGRKETADEGGIQLEEIRSRATDVDRVLEIPRDPDPEDSMEGLESNELDRSENTDELTTNDPGEFSEQVQISEVGLSAEIVSGTVSDKTISDFTEVQTSQLPSAVEETAAIIEEESKEKTDNEKTPTGESLQPDNGDYESPSGLPDENPVRSESQLDGDRLDNDVLPTSTDSPAPADDTDGARNLLGGIEQPSESNGVDNQPDKPQSADEKQESAPENVNSEEDPDVKDELSETVEREKRSVDDNEVDENANNENVANNILSTKHLPSSEDLLSKDLPLTDDIPSAEDVAAKVDVPKAEGGLPPQDIPAIQEIVTKEVSSIDKPTTEGMPTIEDTPAADGDLQENIDDLSKDNQDAMESNVPVEDTNLISVKDAIDIPIVVLDPGSPDDIQDDNPGEEGAVAEGSEPSGEVPSSNTKIPNGDVNRDEGKDVDPPGSPKEAEEEAPEEIANDVAHQKVEDGSNPKEAEEEAPEENADQKVEDDGSNPSEDEPQTKENDDDQSENKDNAGNIDEDFKDIDKEIDDNEIAIDNKEDVSEDPKGDGDDNNNDVEELDKEAPGTPDSVDVISGDRSADENEEDDTSDRTTEGDLPDTRNDAHKLDGSVPYEASAEDVNGESSGVHLGDGPPPTLGNSEGVDVESLEALEMSQKAHDGLEMIVEGDSNQVQDCEGHSGPGSAALEKHVEGEEEVASRREKAAEVGVASPGALLSVGTEDASWVTEGSPRADIAGGVGVGVTSNVDEAPPQDDTGDTNEISNGLSEQEENLEDGDTAKGEGLSNATTAIIGAQSSPDTINNDDFQESDSRLYRSSRRPQTPLPVASTVLTEEDEDEDEDEGVIGDEEEEQSLRHGLVNGDGDGARHLQGRVIGERNMDNQTAAATASNIAKGGLNGGGAGHSGLPKPDPEVERLIARGDLSALAELVLNGEGHRLVGRRSEMPELQSFIENVPTYMAKIQNVHDSARSGQLRELQGALDRRKFAVARDPRTTAGATPLHAAILLGQTAVVRYLAGRFPETLTARDARGRAPLHCAAALPDNGHYFNLLLNLGADRTLKDNNGRTASYYMQNPGVLTHKQLLADINAPLSIADESFADKVPDDKVSSRRRVVNDPELANTMDKYFQVIEEAAVDARTDNRTVWRMVVLKFLTRNVFDQCKYLLTRFDHGILNVIWPVILDQSRSVEDRLKQSGTFFEEAGIVLPDYESYSVFSVIVLPVIKHLNGLDPRQPILPHPPTKYFEDTEDDVSSSGTTVSVLSRMELRNDEAAQRSMDLDPSRKIILHSVAHCTRNLADYNLPQTLTLDKLQEVERYIRRALLTGKSYESKEPGNVSDDQGTYYPLEELSDPLHDIRVKLRSAGQWLEQHGDPDRSMRLHGRHWPLGRGVFVTKDGSIAAYINVQDHLRVMVASKEGQAGKIGLVYRNLGDFMEKVDSIFNFKRDDILGFLAARPWVCGNTLRFKVTVRLPKLGREPEHLIALCKSRSLRLASAASLDVFHFSNRQCLGINEAQVYRSFVTAVANILQLEHRMEANGLHFTTILRKIFRKKNDSANALQ